MKNITKYLLESVEAFDYIKVLEALATYFSYHANSLKDKNNKEVDSKKYINDNEGFTDLLSINNGYEEIAKDLKTNKIKELEIYIVDNENKLYKDLIEQL